MLNASLIKRNPKAATFSPSAIRVDVVTDDGVQVPVEVERGSVASG